MSNATRHTATVMSEQRNLLDLPAEIRISILEYVFQAQIGVDGFKNHGEPAGILVDEEYDASLRLAPLLACRQFYRDGSLLALNRTTFTVSSIFVNVAERLACLHAKQIESIRSICIVADARQFRRLQDWQSHAFGMSSLQLDTLTIVLHRSAQWHYMFDFTADMVQLLRRLQGVKRLVFVRNSARVKGSFKTWYNRLVGLIMKVDHWERYLKSPAIPETTWWKWSYDEVAHSVYLDARPVKPDINEEVYLQQMLPLMEELRISVESEEWNPDPRARTMYY